jgi:hypothetical protein
LKKFRTARIALVCVILIITSLPLRANADLSAILLVDGSNTVTTEEFSLTVQIEGEDMRGGAARLMYDPAQLRVVSVTSRESEDISVRHSEENGVVSFLFTTVEKMSGTLDLLDVVFAVIDGQEGETVTIDMIDRTASDGEREVVPLYTQFIAVLAATMHTETPGIQTETTVPETTAPETTTAEPETEPEPVTETTEAETEPVPETVTTAPPTPGTETETEPGTDAPDTGRVTNASTTAEPPVTETGAETADDGGGDRRPVYLTVMIIAAALLLTGAAVFTAIYLIERHKNKMRNE